MDTGKGYFATLPDNPTEDDKKTLEKQFPAHGQWFKISNIVWLKGSRFEVVGISPTELHLKLLPKLD